MPLPLPEQVPAPATQPGTGPAPDITIIVHGIPAPQGSKRHVGGGVMIESSKKVKPWREAVKHAALDTRLIDDGTRYLEPLDGPLAVSMVFTMRHRPTSRPTWWPRGVRWSRTLMWRPASTPDLSKLCRSTEDALTDAGVWTDDARVVEYRRLAKHYVGDPAGGVLSSGPGAYIAVWRLGVAVSP
ncbi:MAG: RusA family crossover junction endodeoxyribonuclease [Pseudonocardia sp.]